MSEITVKGELDGLLSGYLRRARLGAARKYVEGKGSVLDIGCGVCQWEGILDSNCDYWGVDIEPELISMNRSLFPHWSFEVANLDGATSIHGFGERQFDVIVMLAVIEHFSNPQQIMSIMNGYLRSGGLIVMTTPAPWGDIILDTGALIGLFAKDKHQHYDLLGKKQLFRLAEQSGLTVLEYKRFLYFQNQLAVFQKQ